jgi:hypothetical protein
MMVKREETDERIITNKKEDIFIVERVTYEQRMNSYESDV